MFFDGLEPRDVSSVYSRKIKNAKVVSPKVNERANDDMTTVDIDRGVDCEGEAR